MRVRRKGAAPSPNSGVGGLSRWVQRPSPKGGGGDTVPLGHDAWNVRVRSLWWTQSQEPNKGRGGGGVGNTLGGPSVRSCNGSLRPEVASSSPTATRAPQAPVAERSARLPYAPNPPGPAAREGAQVSQGESVTSGGEWQVRGLHMPQALPAPVQERAQF